MLSYYFAVLLERIDNSQINLKIQFCSNSIWSNFEIEQFTFKHFPLTLSALVTTPRYSFRLFHFCKLMRIKLLFTNSWHFFFFRYQFVTIYVHSFCVFEFYGGKKNKWRFQMIAFRFIHDSAYWLFLFFH